jgi:fermentation-respiration switch protein FrsA (DUF1100 family)
VWGKKAPADLSVVKQPVLVVNGDHDRMVPTSQHARPGPRLPNSQLIIYPDAGHGGAFQFHADFVRSTLGSFWPADAGPREQLHMTDTHLTAPTRFVEVERRPASPTAAGATRDASQPPLLLSCSTSGAAWTTGTR